MKLKLVDYETDGRWEETGTCELCYGTTWADNPVFVFQKESGERVHIDGYYWSWGDYMQVDVDNVIDFASWVATQDLEETSELDYCWLCGLVDQYDGYKEATE